MPEKVLQNGAEALIILHGDSIIKRRIAKSYRLKFLDDKIRKLRTRSEGKLLIKASKIIDVPNVKKINEVLNEITMDFIQGKRLSNNLDSLPLEKQKNILRTVGVNIAKLHDAEIIHGDLTTSNMIYVKKHKGKRGDKIYFIDFGLGFHSNNKEDKAVDLHLLRQALEAKHFRHWQVLFSSVLKGYSTSKQSKIVLEQFKKVEARGRYKDRY